jgi:hypothetical protein
MLKVYADWGDVRYDGDRYRAFCDWWRNRVNTNEERGAYLFAEPLRGRWTHLVEDGERAAEYAEHDDWLVIAIPLPQQRRYVDKSINRLLKKHLPTERGKAVVNPAEHSEARYHLAKAVHVARLERALTLYELKHSQRGKRMSNAKLADAVGLTTKPSQKRMADEQVDAAAKKNTVSTLVSRELRLAREMITHAGVGVFP